MYGERVKEISGENMCEYGRDPYNIAEEQMKMET